MNWEEKWIVASLNVLLTFLLSTENLQEAGFTSILFTHDKDR